MAVLGFFVGIIYLRVLLEFIVIVFRIAENTSVIARNTAGSGGFGVSTTPPPDPPPSSPEAPPPGSAV